MADHLTRTAELIRALYGTGVRHAIHSPGSRSTPLTIAAAIHPGLKKRVVLDERSAAFIALGIGKATGKPALLICTSGTAAANYMPAVTEAKESGVPMILLTADRPASLRGIGSSQTVDQIKMFGDQAIFFHEAGEPAEQDSDLKRLRLLGHQAVESAISEGGAAHINLPFSKPLEPDDATIEAQQLLNEKQLKLTTVGPVVKRSVSPEPIITDLLNGSRRPLIIAGTSNPHHSLNDLAEKVASKLNAPILSEPGSGVIDHAGIIGHYEQFLKNESLRDRLKPDLIIRFGDQPFTKSVITVLDKWNDLPVIHFIGRNAVQDHAMSVTHRIMICPDETFDTDSISGSSADSWMNEWQETEKDHQKRLDDALGSTELITDPAVFRKLTPQIPDDWSVMLSNSLIPRDMAMFGARVRNLFVNRGAAGIDGITATAIGLRQALNRTTLCITGDLAFLHDAGSLLSVNASENEPPLVLLVINNGGGTIFRMLPVHEKKAFYTTYFETPQQADISGLARSYGLEYRSAATLSELSGIRFDEIKTSCVIEVKTDADESMRIRKELWNG